MINFDKECVVISGYNYLSNPRYDEKTESSYVNDENKGEFLQWEMATLMYLRDCLGENHWMTQQFQNIIDADKSQCKISTVHLLIGVLQAFQDYEPNLEKTEDDFLNKVFDNFGSFVTQLRKRHNGRSSIEVSDEYDVQDLLHAILKLNYDDVRPEEWTPSYSGGCNRIDFLLKEQNIAIEVKMTRKGLKDKELGEQLLIDIAKYQQHENVSKLYCFIYDPQKIVGNPVGLAKDLEIGSSENFQVIVKFCSCSLN